MSDLASRSRRCPPRAARWLAVGAAMALATALPVGHSSASTQFQFADVTISNVRLNGGTNVLEVPAGAAFELSLDYAITVPSCPGCIAQILVGFADGGPLACVYDDVPLAGDSGSATVVLTAPATPGMHTLAFDRSLYFQCPDALAAGWWSGAPNRPEQAIGFVTVFTPCTFSDVAVWNVQLNGGSNSLVVPAGTATIDLGLSYTVAVPGCPGCIAQVTVGFANGPPQACVYDAIPGGGASGSANVQLSVPTTPGTYSIVFDRSLYYTCAQALAAGWWSGAPDRPEQVIGTVTVTTPTSFADVTVANVRLDGGTNALVIPAGTATVELSLDYSLSVPGCPGCLAQVMVGFASGPPLACAYDGLPGAGAYGSVTLPLPAPQAPGTYPVVFDRGLFYSCAQALAAGWPNGAPNRTEQRIGTVTVVTPRSFSEIVVSNVRLNGGPGPLVVPAGATFDLAFDYSIAVTGCPSCLAQIMVGYADGEPLACAYQGIPGAGETGSTSVALQAPWTHGIYPIVFDRGLFYTCDDAIAYGWPGGPPTRLQQVIGTLVVNAVAGVGDTPAPALGLRPNAPNPFRVVTVLPFDLPRGGLAELSISDVAGRRIRTLLAGTLPAGSHRIAWDGRDDEGRLVPAGVYFARLAFDRDAVARRLVILGQP